MFTRQDNFVIEGHTVFRDTAQHDVYYVAPRQLHVARTLAQTPSISLMYFGNRAALTLETTWGISSEERTALSQALIEHDGVRDAQREAGDLRLLPVPATQATAQLLLTGGDGSEEVLGETNVNTFGSLHATFSVALSAADAQRFEWALTRPPADAVVRYDVRLVAAALVDVTWELPSLAALHDAADAAPQTIIQRVVALAAAGLATISSTPNALPEHHHAVSLQLAHMVAQHVRSGATGTLRLSHRETFHEPLRLTPSCSLSAELAGVPAPTYVLGRSAHA